MTSLRPSLAIAIVLLIAARLGATDASPLLDDRLSIEHPPPPPIGVTLLEPAWLLPPIESLDAELAAAGLPAGGHLAGRSREPAARVAPKNPASRVSYSLSDQLSAQLRYGRSQGFDRSNSRALRDDASTAFSTLPNRDVFDLNMSWNLGGNQVGVGYQLQSSAGGVWSNASTPAEGGLSRFLPGSEQATHSLMFGLTRPWGAPAPAPVVVMDPHPLVPDLDVAVAEGTPTPAP